jgi:MscS family membrane protein
MLTDFVTQEVQIGLLVISLVAVIGLIGRSIVAMFFALESPVLSQVSSLQLPEVYQKLVKPNEGLLGIAIAIALIEAIVVLLPQNTWTNSLEILISLSLAAVVSWFMAQVFKAFFDSYLLNLAVKSGRKLNSELFILIKWLVNIAIVFFASLIFAQTHQVNVLGLLASLGIGGLAVAFAAQKILEQILGSIVLYLDRPFVVDDYIGLPDGTFGRVEAIGIRSTKIRTSGKGTLVIVPNNALTQTNIENFTGAKKVMSILHLNFYKPIQIEEQSLIRQIILDSTTDIFGIDSRSTEVTFKLLNNSFLSAEKTQAQVTFFILGSEDVSMELRRQLLNITTDCITEQLKAYNIDFDVEEPTVYVDSPITI